MSIQSHKQFHHDYAHGKYSERLTVPLWYALVAAIVVAIFTEDIFLSSHRNPYSYWSAVPLGLLAGWILYTLSNTWVGISSDNVIYAGEQHINAADISRAMVVTPAMKQAALGRQLDPSAYVLHKGWVRTMVILVVDEPNSKVPYWIISTAHPEKFLSALPSQISIIT